MDDETHVVAPAEPDPWRPVSGADLCPLRPGCSVRRRSLAEGEPRERIAWRTLRVDPGGGRRRGVGLAHVPRACEIIVVDRLAREAPPLAVEKIGGAMNGVAARLIDAPGNAVQDAGFASKQMNARGAPIGRQRVARSNDVWPPHRVIARHVLALEGVVGLFLRRIGDAIGEHGGEGVGLSRILEPSGRDFGWCVRGDRVRAAGPYRRQAARADSRP